VYDVTGRQVAVVHDGVVEPGAGQVVHFDARLLPAGRYVFRAEGETFRAAEQLVIVH
jgi:hypothetical protein